MANIKVLLIAMAATLTASEPPVQRYTPSYNYQPPNSGFGNTLHSNPNNGYLPPTNGYNPLSTGYNPPNVGYNPPNTGYNPPNTGYNPPNTGYNPPNIGYNPDGYGSHGHDEHFHGHDSDVPKSYEFGYSVKDAQTGNDYGRHETSDGDTVRGEYRVQLPDGRTQIVTYHADWRTGFHADVRYEGEASYPESQQKQNGYNYGAPAFSGSLTGFHGNEHRPSTAYGPPGYH